MLILPTVTVALAASAVAPSAFAAHPAAKQTHNVTVMTRNLYLGADLTPLLAASNPIAGVVSIAKTVEASKPAKRMAIVAREIKAAHPTLVALQEVSTWKIAGKNPLDGSQVVPKKSYDFLGLLLHDLARSGTPYRVVVSQKNFDSAKQLPAALATLATFNDRDVIIARSGLPTSRLKVVKTHKRHYNHQLSIPVQILGATVNFDRGYEWADVRTSGRTWRFVNTHPEAYTPAELGLTGSDVNGPQATELLNALKSDTGRIVLAGDLNSAVNDPDLKGYAAYVAGGFEDSWLALKHSDKAYTCCRNEKLTGGTLTHRIDHVLTRGGARA